MYIKIINYGNYSWVDINPIKIFFHANFFFLFLFFIAFWDIHIYAYKETKNKPTDNNHDWINKKKKEKRQI